MKQTVYTASPESQQIHVWSLNHDGSLTLTQVVDVPGQVQPMVVSPDKRYLYVGVRPEFRVLAYRIAPDDGALTFAAESALPGSPTHISTDHQGRFVFVGSYNAGSVSVTRLEDGLPVGVVVQQAGNGAGKGLGIACALDVPAILPAQLALQDGRGHHRNTLGGGFDHFDRHAPRQSAPGR